MNCFTQKDRAHCISIHVLAESEYTGYLRQCSPIERTWLTLSGFKAKNGEYSIIPDHEGRPCKVLVICADRSSMWALADLPARLPNADYVIDTPDDAEYIERYMLGWGLGSYQFNSYRQSNGEYSQLARLASDDDKRLDALISSTALVRDLVNLPTNDLLPSQLSSRVQQLASTYSASLKVIEGDELLNQNYPLVHAVGRASSDAPRLLDLRWGKQQDPLVCLVGKGVCFDSGGLDIKTASGMRWMKKDMGGAAHVLGIAQYVMQTGLPIQLRVLIPAVENAVGSNAFRPGDILSSRSGKSVEIDNTDAEGRLILADALYEACNDKPELLIDFATLTGAARIALGTEVGVFFSNQVDIATQLQKHSQDCEDPIWQLPLYRDYRVHLDSDVADIVNSASSSYGGAITAALFLQEFIQQKTPWVHFDVMAFNLRARPGRPKGGEAMGLRTVCSYLEQRYRL